MFTKMKNIDTALRHLKLFSIAVIAACVVVTCFALWKCFSMVAQTQSKVYILSGGKALEAFSAGRKDNLPVEARDHVKTFHELFFTLDPDDKVIRENVAKALYLADNSAKRVYDDLKEGGYYSGIISGNISQGITVDSIVVSVENYPYYFRCYAKQQIVRPTSILKRNLITEGNLRNVSRSDNNPHGFLIERWRTLDNKDIGTENRH